MNRRVEKRRLYDKISAMMCHIGIIVRLVFLLAIPLNVSANQDHQVLFQHTDYELNVYRIYGEESGKTLLIIGGIQGNEPGGYLAADFYVEMSLRKGNLIVVPRANFSSILRNVRGVNGDMNRKFANVDLKNQEGIIIEKLKELIKESDFLLNLHDGSGFYSRQWESKLRNPMKYGQSLIADCEILSSKNHNTVYNLGEIAQRVCTKVNEQIRNRKHHFNFNNHNTFSPETKHSEQRKSATFFAMSEYEIPAFGIETSKNIPSPEKRVRYQTIVINTFMEEFGIIPQNPSIALPDPLMDYLIMSINGNKPIVVYNNEKIFLEKGDELDITHIEANYVRGLTANILGVGSYNDMRKKLFINKNTDIIVKKDNLKCGKVSLALKSSSGKQASNGKIDIKYLILQVNSQKMALSPGDHQKVNYGDILSLRELITYPRDGHDLKVNFKGFVGNKMLNDGEDRGYSINTARDLMQRYSKNKQGYIYNIVVSKKGKHLTDFFIDLMPYESVKK